MLYSNSTSSIVAFSFKIFFECSGNRSKKYQQQFDNKSHLKRWADIYFFLIFQRRFSEFLFEKDDKMGAIRKSGAHTRVRYRMSVWKQNSRVGQSDWFEIFSRRRMKMFSEPTSQGGGAYKVGRHNVAHATDLGKIPVNVIQYFLKRFGNIRLCGGIRWCLLFEQR